MTTIPVLYSFRRCPYAMRARMALLVSGTSFELREVKLAAKPEAMLAASPKGTVPVLMTADGQVIDESLEIMRWALERNDPEHWLSGDDASLVEANDGPFKHHLDRYKYATRHGSNSIEHRSVALEILETLEERLQREDFLTGRSRTLADIAIMPFVRQFAEADRTFFDALPLPALHQWLAWHLNSDLFAQAMLRMDPWRPGDPPKIVQRQALQTR
ncbi:MAG: glutathione S-transferase [Sphingobium sp.]